jgi:FixJ family two-component response regulator
MSEARRTVVVVDDDSEMSEAVERLLSAAGFHAMAFGSAEALLEDGTAIGADCFILDIHLPGISGFELQKQILLRRAVAPVIFITAHDDSAAREHALAAGAVAFFAKPFRGQPLLSAITDALLPQ